MWFVWISAVHLNLIRVSAQFNFQEWQYRSPHQQQITENPVLFPHHLRSQPKISIPVYEFNPNLYPISFPVSAQPPLSLGAFTVPTISLQNLPFQPTWMTSSPPLLTNQKEYFGYATEMKKSSNFMNSISTIKEKDYDISVHVMPNLPDFLRRTSDDVKKNFYNVVSNPNESFQQKQSKVDQLVLSLDSKNQELYHHYRKMKELKEREKREQVHTIVADMSDKAQAVFAKLSAVLMNPEMKDIDRMNKINDFYRSVDEDVKNEFKDKIYGLNWQL
uniref:SXP/RAL-2 family protein Ani s 5-like cation-binding domain-containing protein n=1 Tax=Wuchereria bancrofti TaxID=6293 RepID=A0AAF5Q3A3_WUCBA